LDTYWKKTGATNLSAEFKDLILRIFSYDPSKRPTIDEIRAHPWMCANPVDMKQIRSDILNELAEKRSAQTQDTSREDVNSRGDAMLDLVRETSVVDLCRFNDMKDHDIDVVPGVIWDDINTFNVEHCDSMMQIEKVEGKCLKITLPGETGEDGTSNDLVVKVKFYKLASSDPEQASRTRVRFVRKRGDLEKWYSLFRDMKDAIMEDVLLAPTHA